MLNYMPDCESDVKIGNQDAEEETTDLLIGSSKGHIFGSIKPNGLKKIPSKLNDAENRSQSLPDCSEEKNTASFDTVDHCSVESKLLPINASPLQSPTSDLWFKTWPNRGEKQKSTESSPDNSIIKSNNTQEQIKCDNLNLKTTKNHYTLNEALQNISLAYSPVTKQLHLVEKKEQPEIQVDNNKEECKKYGHKRHEAGSFSSTISTYSEAAPSDGSFLDSDDRSLSSFDEDVIENNRKKSLTNFFTKNVFNWKGANGVVNGGNSLNVWKLFSKGSQEDRASSPLHVASSSALIQHGRPLNLPAKTVEEEQRHREEYKAMVAAAKKKEAQNAAAKQKQQKLQLQQEEQQALSTKHFLHKVLPNWDNTHRTKKTQDLWWQGLPSSVRGKVWRLAIGNELNVTPQLYEICLSRAQSRLNSPAFTQSDSQIDQESSMDLIQLDISRTFPHLCIFQEGGPYSDVLHSLLAAYVCYRPDVGYVQGMSYIAAILILNMEQFDAFVCFANILNQSLHLSAFTLNQDQMAAYYSAYNEVFCYNLPKLYAHFEQAGLTPDLYLLDWIYTVYAKAMPLDVACRVWDVFLRDGYEFIFRTALGILHLNQDTLLTMDFLHGAQFLTRLPDDLSSDQLFKSIQLITTTIGKQCFSQIVDKCSYLMSESVS